MGAYQRFGVDDLLHSEIRAAPRTLLASGSVSSGGLVGGWRGSVGVSSSLSLYDGIRARLDVGPGSYAQSGLTIVPFDPVPTHSIEKTIFISGSYPATGSIQFVKVRTRDSTKSSEINATNWYSEHMSPILGLFDFYKRYNTNYNTSSFDYYCLHTKQQVNKLAQYVIYPGASLPNVSSSFTCEMMVKPMSITGSQDFFMQGQMSRWKFYITGSSGKLAFSDFATTVTSSLALSQYVWQDVAVIVGNGSASFYINGIYAGASAYTGTLLTVTSSLTVAAELFISGSTMIANNGFDGFLFESRIWSMAKSLAQLSSTLGETITTSGSDSTLKHYSRFNDGPLSTQHGFSVGSGALDYSSSSLPGRLTQFDAVSPAFTYGSVWQVNDDQNFVTLKTLRSETPTTFKVLHCPSLFYGRQLATGSISLTCNTYLSGGIVRVLNDDGRGGLYLSGSVSRQRSGEEYKGVGWNRVGSVFYSEGLVVITDPSLLDFGEVYPTNLPVTGTDLLQVVFSGDERLQTKVFTCRAGSAQLNASSNPTYARKLDTDYIDSVDDKYLIRSDRPVTYITAVGLYNDRRDLVAVAKMAQPVRKREKDRIMIRLRLDI